MKRASILSLIGSGSAGYFKVDRAGLTWSGANDACKAKGLNLVTFDDEAEYKEVMAFIGDSTAGYWTGFRDDHGTVEPAGYHPFAEGEPNNKVGDEFCIRLRFGLMNDALCEIYWVGPKKQKIGMGYICEGDVESESSDESGVRGLDDMIGGVDLVDPDVSFPTHIMSNVFRSNKKPDAKLSNGVFELTDMTEAGRPVYHNTETNAYLSFSYNSAEQEEDDGKWKFSSKNQVGPSIGGNVFIDSRAQTPDQIETDSKCFWFKHYGPKKNRKFRSVNCIYSPELFSFDGEGAIGVTFSKGPKSKLSFLSGVYAPTTLDTYDNAYAKVGGDIYAVKRNQRWEFVEIRDIHTDDFIAYIESDSDSLAGSENASAMLGKKPTSFKMTTF